jgi:arylsulfatase A-like enzyme
MSYYTVHGPFHSKPEKTKKYAAKANRHKVKLKSAAYAGMVESLDENLGRMLDWLDKKELRKNMIVILTSDNGGMIRATHNRPLRSYKGDLYEGGIRVPYIVDWPGVIKPGSVSDTPVHGVDFYATLLAMTGLPQQTENHEDSVNLVPLLKGDEDFKRAPLVWHVPVGVPHIAHSKPGSVIRSGDWKFLRFYEDVREELYNLKDDIGETKNLAASMPKKAAELKSQLDAVLKAHNAEIPIDVPAKPIRRPRKKKPGANTQDAKPNIIFILADDMGYGDLGCYGAKKICVPGKQPAVCNSLVELLDLYPTVSKLCGLKVPENLQGRDISPMLDDPKVRVRDAILCSGKGRLYREDRWALLDYGKNGELYDMQKDPKQYTNLFSKPEYAEIVSGLKQKLKAKLAEVSKNDLGKEQP